MQWVCYIEVQGLYAAAARQAGLAPVERPVVVLQAGRVFDGCRDAFAGGLTLGAPARQARRDAPQATLVEFDQLNAEAVARAMWDQALAHTPYIEPRELHQLYLALPTPGEKLTAALRTEAELVVAKAAAHGFVAFAGVAPTKLAARAAALSCKENWLLWRPGKAAGTGEPGGVGGPGGLRGTGGPGRAGLPELIRYVSPGAEAEFLAPLPLGYLPMSADVARRVSRLGLRFIGEAARISESEWLRQLGPAGRQVARWSRGLDGEAVLPCYPPRTQEYRLSYTPEVQDRDLLEQGLSRAAAFLARELTAAGEGCQQVVLTVERANGPQVAVQRTLAKLQQSAYPIRQALFTLLGEALTEAGAVTALTAAVGLIGPMPWQQMELWDDSGGPERQERLERAMAFLQERFPPRMVGLGLRQGLSWREQMLTFNDPYRTGFSAAHLSRMQAP